MKVCRCCGEEKALIDFYANPRTKDKLGSWCKICVNEKAKESVSSERVRLWLKAHPKASYQYQRTRRLKKYNLDTDKYTKILETQNFQCAICKTTSTLGKALCVDHSHITGANRGLLCFHCNLLIGHAKDDINILQNAISYLNQFPSTKT